MEDNELQFCAVFLHCPLSSHTNTPTQIHKYKKYKNEKLDTTHSQTPILKIKISYITGDIYENNSISSTAMLLNLLMQILFEHTLYRANLDYSMLFSILGNLGIINSVGTYSA